ncbi:DUF2505 domain-containing protein [Actinomyces radicidentis]|uniref:DUF2505 domain-containing protein n=1 Tax=Actinomyces radicidentis TaxID=111015 RepID=UPI0026DFF5E4|nr:DUF2505 domain-containing protein [Actinomyces radicidentis]
MRKSVTITYPADPARVAAMLADPAYQRRRAARLGLDDADVDVTPSGEGFTATLSGTVPPTRLPSAARRFVRSALSFTVTESWGGPGAEGTRTGALDVAATGAPVRASATGRLAPVAAGTAVTYDVDLSVSVPLVGRSIEDKALSMSGRVVTDEEKRGADWLAAH